MEIVRHVMAKTDGVPPLVIELRSWGVPDDVIASVEISQPSVCQGLGELHAGPFIELSGSEATIGVCRREFDPSYQCDEGGHIAFFDQVIAAS